VLVSTVARYAVVERVQEGEPIAEAPQSKALLQLAARVALSDASVMIMGPSGSGKEVLARYVHQHSARAEAPFVAINCAAIPDNMLESTLFGYEKGAFTGAIAACPGKFEQAQGGTLLLDEITEMPLSLQAKLLRVLQEREVERLGSRKTIKLNIRVLATSNRDLKQAVSDGVFREDLYYRLNVFPLCWPSLAERAADIVPLAQHLLQRHCKQQQRPVATLHPTAALQLAQYHWPGNVRELDNVIQRALILQPSTLITTADILLESVVPATVMADASVAEAELDISDFKSEIHEQEHKLILATMQACSYKRKDVAQKLGISDRTLRYKLARMRESGIELPA